MDIQEQQQMSLMEITRILTRMEKKLDRILSEPSCKTPEEWKLSNMEVSLDKRIRELIDPIPY